ncbi:hypothetical protein ACQCN2_07985 [Brevibacillus ginsengisoli]|uniref:hypothetical protein n=1 Tax=Brevibacillus ginsengisoli TaxID=363854 RepID=UPI003CE68493
MMTFTEAQIYTNFVVLEPTDLPEASRVSSFSVRKETEQIRSSIRFEVADESRVYQQHDYYVHIRANHRLTEEQVLNLMRQMIVTSALSSKPHE